MPGTTDSNHLAEALDGLRAELERLCKRVAALEATAAANASAAPESPGSAQAVAAEPVAQPDGLDEELVLVISAAIAAFLGKKAHIRQIHVLRQDAWAQQGRVTIQASHRLAGPHH
jgi:methylmalonyl-CoA carboxyltransferase large subunit